MAANPQPHILVGAYNLFIGESTQTAFPSASEDPPFVTATKVYSQITDDTKDLPASGIRIARAEEIAEFTPLGALLPIKKWLKKSGWMISGQIANWSASIVEKLVEDGISGKLGARGPVLKEYRALIRGAGGSPESGNTGGDKNWQLEIPKCVIETQVDTSLGLNDEPAMLNWQIGCLYDATLEAAIKVVAES